jgi:hypothetical protein
LGALGLTDATSKEGCGWLDATNAPRIAAAKTTMHLGFTRRVYHRQLYF